MYQLFYPAPPVFLNQTPGATGRAAGSTPPGCLLAFTLKRVLNQALFTANIHTVHRTWLCWKNLSHELT